MAPADAPAAPLRLKAAVVAGMVLTGALHPLLKKVMVTMMVAGAGGEVREFGRTWFAALLFYLGTALVGSVGASAARSPGGHPARGGESPPAAGPAGQQQQPTLGRRVRLAFVPAACGLVAMLLCGVALKHLSVGLWQMLQSLHVAFVAILAVAVLGQRNSASKWLGLACSVAGVVLAGLAGRLNDAGASGTGSATLGIVMVTLGSVFMAFAIVAEEYVMKKSGLRPLQLVGLEGCWGVALMLVVALPAMRLLSGGDLGDLQATLKELEMNPKLLAVATMFVLGSGAASGFTVAVIALMSSVHRTLFGQLRTCLVWVAGLIIHYGFDPEAPVGEVWARFSPLQVAGFVVLVVGQLIYGGVIRVPGLDSSAKVSGEPCAKQQLHLRAPPRQCCTATPDHTAVFGATPAPCIAGKPQSTSAIVAGAV